MEGYPTVEALAAAEWTPLLGPVPLAGDTANGFAVEGGDRVTHVRLTIDPDGGVARLRVHGEPVPDPRLLDAGPFDLAALENGGLITGCSNEFYGRPTQLIAPGLARHMGEGWRPHAAATAPTTGSPSASPPPGWCGWPSWTPAGSCTTPRVGPADRSGVR